MEYFRERNWGVFEMKLEREIGEFKEMGIENRRRRRRFWLGEDGVFVWV